MQQGSVLSPLLFSVLLDTVLMTSEVLIKCIEKGDLIAFADDILVMAADLNEAEIIIKEMEALGLYGLCVNKKKTKIITDIKELKDVKEI